MYIVMKQKKHNNKLFCLLLFCTTLFATASCTKDEEAPRIDSVWLNMVEQPIEQITCAYPGQTICVRGENLGDLKHVIVNGTEINLNTLYVYESDKAITFQLPSYVKTTGDLLRVVTSWGMSDFAFIVRPKSEQPAITSFSATTLIAGRTLTIMGTNLDGVEEVWLPLTFGGSTKCEIDASDENTASEVHVVIPDDVSFATGRCEIVMQKSDSRRGITYIEKVYSSETNFK